MRLLLGWLRTLPLAALLALPALAQDVPPAPPPEQPPAPAEAGSAEKSADKVDRFGEIYGAVEVWAVSPSGTEFSATAAASSGSSYSSNSTIGDDNRTSFRYQVGYRFRDRSWGGFLVSYWDSKANSGLNASSPGVYQYFEALSVAPLAGYRNDGLADGYASLTESVTRQFRFDYTRDAFQSGNVSGTWLIGYTNFAHQRDDKATYYALAPPFLPPLIEPQRSELVPVADTGQSSSAFGGNGIEGGMDFRFDVHKKVALETGVRAAMIWGTLETGYQTQTSAYIINQGQDNEFVLPASQYQQEFEENPTLVGIAQRSFPGVVSYKQSSTVQELDLYLGARWKAWAGLEVTGGFRAERYENAIAYLQPLDSQPSIALGSTLIQSTTLTRSTVTFFGFYASVGYRY